MNINLPAILVFTRGTRFWHTAIQQSFKKHRYHHRWMTNGRIPYLALSVYPKLLCSHFLNSNCGFVYHGIRYTVYPISGQTHLGGFWDVFDWNLLWLLTTCSERNYFSCSVNTILYYIYISKRFHTHHHRWQHLPTGMLSLKLLPCLRDPPSSTKASLAMVWVSMEVLPLSGGISKTHLKIQYWGIMITRFNGKSTIFRWFSQ